jgi:hypothetical protein
MTRSIPLRGVFFASNAAAESGHLLTDGAAIVFSDKSRPRIHRRNVDYLFPPENIIWFIILNIDAKVRAD